MDAIAEKLEHGLMVCEATGTTLVHIDSTDAGKLLEMLTAVKPVHNDALVKCGWDDVYNCGACGNQLRSFANYCDKCGRKVEKAEKAVRRGKKIRL